MRRTNFTRFAAPAAAVLTALLMTAACGDVEVTSDDDSSANKDKSTPSADANADVDTSAAEGNWLLGIQAAGGADGETSTTTYVTYNPSTGQATARKLPGVQAASASPDVGRAAGQRRPQVGHPRHRDLAVGGEHRPAQGLLAGHGQPEGRRHPARHRRRRRQGDRLGLRPGARRHAARRRHGQPRVVRERRRWQGHPGGHAGQGPVGVHQRLQPQHRRALHGEHRERRDQPGRQRPRRHLAGHPRRRHHPPRRVRGHDQAPRQPVPPRRRLHRRQRRDLGLLRGRVGADDVLPAQGRREVDGVRQAEQPRWPRSPPVSRWSCRPPQ